jgi:hypothetical protein
LGVGAESIFKDYMSEVVNFLTVFLAIYFVGKLLFFVVQQYIVYRLMTQIHPELEPETPDVMLLNIEKFQDQYYCYNTTSGEFVCQGSSIPELDQQFHSRYPGMKALISSADSTAVRSLCSEPEILKASKL